MSKSIHEDAVAPYSLIYDATSDDAAFDLTTITSVAFHVLRQGGATATWAGTVSSATATAARFTHVFVVGDVPDEGVITVEPHASTPAGEFVFEPKQFNVRKKFT